MERRERAKRINAMHRRGLSLHFAGALAVSWLMIDSRGEFGGDFCR